MTFDELRGRPRGYQSHGCPVCGDKNVGQVQILLGELSTDRKKAATIKSMSRRMCERHTIQMYESLERTYKSVLDELRGEWVPGE